MEIIQAINLKLNIILLILVIANMILFVIDRRIHKAQNDKDSENDEIK